MNRKKFFQSLLGIFGAMLVPKININHQKETFLNNSVWLDETNFTDGHETELNLNISNQERYLTLIGGQWYLEDIYSTKTICKL